MKPLPAEAEVVIVGAGVAGAATASFLRERGLRPLVGLQQDAILE